MDVNLRDTLRKLIDSPEFAVAVDLYERAKANGMDAESLRAFNDSARMLLAQTPDKAKAFRYMHECLDVMEKFNGKAQP